MSLFAGMNTAISGLKSNSAAFGYVSENIANANTTGYKRYDSYFSQLVTQTSEFSHSAAGVKVKPLHRVEEAGLQESSAVKTNMSISGDGMFIVTDKIFEGSQTGYGQRNSMYTRDGSFDFNKEGYLVNASGYNLLGWNTDASGNVQNSSQLAPVQVKDLVDPPKPTENVQFYATLPAGSPGATESDLLRIADLGDIIDDKAIRSRFSSDTYDSVFESQSTFNDGLGTEHTLNMRWAKLPASLTVGTGDVLVGDGGVDPLINPNKWFLTVDPVSSVDAGIATSPDTAHQFVVEFNEDGTLRQIFQPTDGGVVLNDIFGAGTAEDLGDVSGTSTKVSGLTSIATATGVDLMSTIFNGKGIDPTNGTDSSGNKISISLNWATTTGNNGVFVVDHFEESVPSSGNYDRIVLQDPAGSIGDVAVSETINIGLLGQAFSAEWQALPSSEFDVTIDFGGGAYLPTDPQVISLDIGEIGDGTIGTNQWDVDEYLPTFIEQDGYSYGEAQDISIDENGVVNASFSNGVVKSLYKIPIAKFANFNQLESLTGNAFKATSESGNAFYVPAGRGGMGSFAVQSIEKSNVDIAQEFTKIITLQRTYSANSNIIKTADEMMEDLFRKLG